jgi:hypothetical protein
VLVASVHTQALTHLLREFMAGLREHLAAEEVDPEQLADQLAAAIAAVTSALVLAWPLARRRGVVGVLLALVHRYWARRAIR